MVLTIDEYKSRVDMLDKTITELVGAIQVLYDFNDELRDRCEYLRKLCVASTVKLTRYRHETPLWLSGICSTCEHCIRMIMRSKF